MVIDNQIFAAFRAEKKEVDDAIKLLESKGYIVYNKEKKLYHETNR